MKKFMVLYHTAMDPMAQTANSTAEEQQKGMEQWMQWSQKAGSHLVDFGMPLMGGKTFRTDGGIGTSNKDVTGYSILQAESLQEVQNLLKGHPHLGGWDQNATIEVHEMMPVPGME